MDGEILGTNFDFHRILFIIRYPLLRKIGLVELDQVKITKQNGEY